MHRNLFCTFRYTNKYWLKIAMYVFIVRLITYTALSTPGSPSPQVSLPFAAQLLDSVLLSLGQLLLSKLSPTLIVTHNLHAMQWIQLTNTEYATKQKTWQYKVLWTQYMWQSKAMYWVCHLSVSMHDCQRYRTLQMFDTNATQLCAECPVTNYIWSKCLYNFSF